MSARLERPVSRLLVALALSLVLPGSISGQPLTGIVSGVCAPRFESALKPDQESLVLKLCNGEDVSLAKQAADQGVLPSSQSTGVWIGRLSRGKGKIQEAGALLVFLPSGPDGLVFLNSSLYRLQPDLTLTLLEVAIVNSLPAFSALFKHNPATMGAPLSLRRVDPIGLPPIHRAPAEAVPPASLAGLAPSYVPAGDSWTRIDVILVYSREAVMALKMHGGPAAYSLLLEAATNWTFSNSGSKIRVRILDSVESMDVCDANPSSDALKLGQRLASNSSPISAYVEHADVIGWLGLYCQECGQTPNAVEGKTRLLAVDYRCAVEKFGLAHELGHILGANHNDVPGMGKLNEKGPSHAHCSRSQLDKWMTVMGSPVDQNPQCEVDSTVLPFWSAAGKCLLGEPLGVPDFEDNAWVIEQTAQAIAALRP